VEPKSVVVVGIEPADIQPFGVDLTEEIAAKVDELLLRVIDELKALEVECPQKKV
jgi:Ni,Fe-hydrogenase maturation factor